SWNDSLLKPDAGTAVPGRQNNYWKKITPSTGGVSLLGGSVLGAYALSPSSTATPSLSGCSSPSSISLGTTCQKRSRSSVQSLSRRRAKRDWVSVTWSPISVWRRASQKFESRRCQITESPLACIGKRPASS